MIENRQGKNGAGFRNNWRPLLVIFAGLLFSIYLFLLLQPKRPDLPSHQPAYTKAREYHPGGRDCSPATLSAIRGIRERASKSDDCADKAEDYRLKYEDLTQQTRAADAAQSQARSAYEQGWLALWATLGGFWTLIAAGMAAFYARDAAREAKRTANVAWSIGIAQVRARIALQDYAIATPGSIMRLGNDGSVFFLKIRNIGLTPAEQIDVSGTIEAALPTGEVVQSALSLNPESKREIEGQTTERLPLICGQNFRDSFVPIIGGDQIAFKAVLKVSASDLFDGRESLHFEVKGSFGGGGGVDCQWYGEVVPESVRRQETRKPQEPE